MPQEVVTLIGSATAMMPAGRPSTATNIAGFCRATHAGHPIQLVVSSSNAEERPMNVLYRVELSQAERDEFPALLRGGKHSARKPAAAANSGS